MKELQKTIQELLEVEDSKAEVKKVTLELVKRAACSLKPHKMDV